MRGVVGKASRLLQAMVDVISSSGWLNPALAGACQLARLIDRPRACLPGGLLPPV